MLLHKGGNGGEFLFQLRVWYAARVRDPAHLGEPFRRVSHRIEVERWFLPYFQFPVDFRLPRFLPLRRVAQFVVGAVDGVPQLMSVDLGSGLVFCCVNARRMFQVVVTIDVDLPKERQESATHFVRSSLDVLPHLKETLTRVGVSPHYLDHGIDCTQPHSRLVRVETDSLQVLADAILGRLGHTCGGFLCGLAVILPLPGRRGL